MSKEELAKSYFLQGYSCSQAVALAFKEYFKGLDEKTILKISSPFGGGLGRLRQTCGAFSSIALVVGYIYGNDSNDIKKKEEIYKRVQELSKSFRNEYGTLSCKQILNIKDNKISYIPSQRTAEYYRSRPCKDIVGFAAKILEQYLNNN